MSCGVPAVCSIIAETADIVEDRINGFLFEQNHTETLASYLHFLTTKPDLRNQLSEAARQKAIKYFDCRQTAKKIIDSIQKHSRKAKKNVEFYEQLLR